MRLRPTIVLFLYSAAIWATFARTAWAQPAPPAEGTPPTDAVSPPELKRFVPAQTPDSAPGAEPVSVLLEFVVDEQGRVTEARVTESAGPEYDSAALEAVRQFEFEPARRGGQPIAVKLSYRYVFRADEPPTPAVAPAKPPPAEPSDSVEPTPSPVAEPGPSPDPVPATSDAIEHEFGATAEIEAPPRETTKRVVQGEKLTKIPGTGGDAMRAIEVMPGVARTDIGSGDPILRGAAWHESVSYIDAVPVPLLYHFGGVKSTFNSQLLERVEYYPGNFSVRFGRVTGGIIDARVRTPRTDRLHGRLELSVLDSSALLESPVTDDFAVALAARRSNIDFFYETFVPDDAFNVVAAPLYWDYQAIGSYALGSRHRLRVMGYGSRDSIRLFFVDPSAFDPALRGRLEVALEHHRLQANLDSELSSDVQQSLQVTLGRSVADQYIGPVDAWFRMWEIYGRGEWRAQVAPSVQLNLGFDVDSQLLFGEYTGPRPPQAEGDPEENSSLAAEEIERVDVEDDFIALVRPAGYVELELRLHPRLLLVPGLRLDYYGYVEEWSLDPRLAARYEVGATTTAKWGVGVFSQPPQYYEAIPGFGNPDVEPYRALHTSAGLEQKLGGSLEVGLEGFYKRLIHRVVTTPGGAPPTFTNDGVGRIYGAELSAKLETERSFGYLAYTLSRSERRDRNQPWRLFDQDQTHILSLVASRDLGRGWELGGRFRLVSGNPETPVVGAVYDAGIDVYRPRYGTVNSTRTPLFHQLDLRIEKQWRFSAWILAAYLDLQNAYNAQHQEGADYSFDYSEQQTATGLPITPNLGIVGEL